MPYRDWLEWEIDHVADAAEFVPAPQGRVEILVAELASTLAGEFVDLAVTQPVSPLEAIPEFHPVGPLDIRFLIIGPRVDAEDVDSLVEEIVGCGTERAIEATGDGNILVGPIRVGE